MLVFGTVSMGITLSVCKFRALRFIARQLNYDIDWDVEVKKFTSCLVPGTRVFNLKFVFEQVQTNHSTDRLLAFIRFADELKLSEEEWDELYIFLGK